MSKVSTLHDATLCKVLLDKLSKNLKEPLRFMEVCGTHTVALFKGGLCSLLPEGITHLTGPGCPVCVTHDREVSVVLSFAEKENIILATFGDFMRVPGPQGRSLKHAQADGARVSVIYSPMDLLTLATNNPSETIVFPSIGFETTAPTIAATILMAEKQKIKNLKIIPCHKLVPPAIEALLMDPECAIDAFLMPGHVSMVLGLEPYNFIATKWNKPAVVSGFEPADILDAICRLVDQKNRGEATVDNAYPRAVCSKGNPQARKILYKVFRPSDAYWRGIEVLPMSGLLLNAEYEEFNALSYFGVTFPDIPTISDCICGEILKGKMKPNQCLLFGNKCTPENPIGPCMVSTEGSCAAYFKYSV